MSMIIDGRLVLRGMIRERVLLNALVDPDEAASQLPAGLRPHITGGATVVGCCLLDIDHLRPSPLPPGLGLSLRSVAHRISVDWDEPDGTVTTGVYVPARYTDSRLGRLAGGRLAPGIQAPAAIRLARVGDDGSRWTVRGLDGTHLEVEARPAGPATSEPGCDIVSATCLAAAIGLSPGFDGTLEASHMQVHHGQVEPILIEDLHSTFLQSFRTARPAPAVRMSDAEVNWTQPATPAAQEAA